MVKNNTFRQSFIYKYLNWNIPEYAHLHLIKGEDGSKLSFKISPKSPKEWFYHNTKLSELYSKKYPLFKIEDFKNEFNESLINYPYLEKRKEAEFEFIKNFIQADDPKGLSYWYNQVRRGKVPTDNERWRDFLSKEIKYGLEVFLHAKAVAEYEGFLESFQPSFKSENQIVEDSSIQLSDLFQNNESYEKIMDILVNKGHCQPITFIWKDEKKGSKSILASLIKNLHAKGYLTEKPSNDLILGIAKNTFGIDLKIDTVKQSKADKYIFKYIPSANNMR